MSDKLEGLREYIRANMMDGCEQGLFTAPSNLLLDDIVECVLDFILEQQQAAPSAGQTDSQTPETDAFYAELYDARTPSDMVDAASGKEREKMASLERRLAEAQRELATALEKARENAAAYEAAEQKWFEALNAPRSASAPAEGADVVYPWDHI